MVYVLFLLSMCMSSFQSVLLKKYRQGIDEESLKDSIYFLITIIVSLAYYAIQSGFDLRVNIITAIFSCAFAVAACLAVSIQMRALENANMVTVLLFTSAGGMLWDTVFGTLMFSEALTLKRVVGLAMVFASVLIPYITERKSKINKKGLFYCLLLFVIGGYSTLVLKLHSRAENVMRDSVFCFYTNVFMIPFVLYLLRKNNTIKNTVKGMLEANRQAIFLAAVSVLVGSISTLIQMYVIGKIDLIVYSVLGKALSLITVSVFARIAFREEITYKNIVCILLAVSAAAITII